MRHYVFSCSDLSSDSGYAEVRIITRHSNAVTARRLLLKHLEEKNRLDLKDKMRMHVEKYNDEDAIISTVEERIK